MSDVGEREALEPRTLLEHATILQRAHPDGPLPDGGRPYPDTEHFAGLPRTDEPYAARRRQLVDVVTSVYEAEPSADRACGVLADALTSLRVEPRFAGPLAEAVASFDLAWRRRVGRELAYRKTHARRLMTLEEMANVAVFVASDKASGMTGTTVNLRLY